MDFGIDTLIYLLLGIVFVLFQATRRKKPKPVETVKVAAEEEAEPAEELSAFWKEFLGASPAADRVPELAPKTASPPVFTEPADFQRIRTASPGQDRSPGSFHDPGERAAAGVEMPARPAESDQSQDGFDLRKAVIYSVILERKYND